MWLARPEALWLLLLLIPVVLLRLRARRLGTASGLPAAALRLLALALVVLALARPVIRDTGPDPLTVVVADLSPSMGSREVLAERLGEVLHEIPEDHEVRLVAVAGTPEEVPADPPGSRRFPELPRKTTGPADADAGLLLAAGLLPANRPGSVVLLGDGRWMAGADGLGARALTERGVPVDVVPMGVEAPHPVLLPLDVPASWPTGATLPLELVVEGDAKGALVHAAGAGLPEGGLEQVLQPAGDGSWEVTLDLEVPAPGRNAWSLELRDAGGGVIPESARRLVVTGRPPRRILVVTEDGGGELAERLAPVLGPGMQLEGLAPGELEAAAGQPAAGVVMADVPGAALDARAVGALEVLAERGTGLLLAGGRRSFGPGGYAGTRLERLLPVRFVQKEERRDPGATLVVIIDTSGSMTGARMDLAKEVARLALRRLKPHDKAGIVEFHGARRWAAPIQPASNAVALKRALNRLNAGGGTVILPAIRESYYALLNARTRIRHVLVITDGGVESGDFESLIRRMSDHGITLSSVLVGPGGHSRFLMNLAQWGRGRFYHAPDRFNLPEVIVKQPDSTLLAPWSEGEMRVAADDGSWVSGQLHLERGPSVAGLLELEARPTAEVLLRTDSGRPLLARWWYGAGSVAVWATHLLGPWTGALASEPDYGRLLSGLIREGAPELAPGEAGMQVRVRGDSVAVLPWGDPGELGRSVQVVLEPAGAAPRSRVVALEGPDAREHPRGPVFAGVPAGPVGVSVRTATGREAARGSVVVPASREWTARRPDAGRLRSLARMTGGRVAPPLSAARDGGGRLMEVWPWVLGAALVVFLLQVLARRLPPRVAATLLLPLLLTGGLGAQEPATRPAALPDDAEEALQQAAQAPLGSQARAAALGEACRAVAAESGSLEPLLRVLEGRDSGTPSQRALLARALQRAGRHTRALEILDGTSERPLPLELQRARLLEFAGRDDEALALLEELAPAVEDPALRLQLLMRRAGLALDDGEEAASRVLEELRARVAEQEALRFPLGLLAALYGQPDLLLGWDPQGGTPKETFLLTLFAGTFELRAGNAGAAREHFQEAVELAPLERDRRYALERLIAAHRAGRTLGELADRWLEQPELDPERRSALVAVLRELRRPEEALDLLDRLPRSQSMSPRLAEEVVKLAAECGRHEEGVQVYRNLIAEEPGRLVWRSALGLLHLLEGDQEAAAAVLEEALEQVEDGAAALRVAAAARDLALFEVAQDAALKALEDADSEVRAHLFLAELAHRLEDTEAAVVHLKEASEVLDPGDSMRALVAEAYERFGRPAEAAEILTTLHARGAGEDLTMRLAWLLRKLERPEEALRIWFQLWETTRSPARKRQAETQILEISAARSRVADLAIELEEKLDHGLGDVGDLRLLVKVYTRAGDSVAAVEVLRAYAGDVGQGEVETLKAMAEVYRACNVYTRYEETLRELQEMDPGNAVSYQEEIALGALERGRGVAARRAVDRLLEMSGESARAQQFAAGVLSMVGLTEESLAAYTRVLARHPGQIELHLLRARVMAQLGRADEARNVFLDLLDRAEEDDLFTVAVDGLLNLRAPAWVLDVALRRVLERIAASPRKLFLYELAADLMQETGDVKGRIGVTSLSVLVAGRQRSAILRELMELEASRGDVESRIAFGRSLLALGEEMPPEVFVDLGRALLKTGDLATAARVFGRARTVEDFAGVQKQVADAYREAGHYQLAEQVLRLALLTRPDDVALLIDVGELARLGGHEQRAARDYRRAFDILVRRSPLHVGEGGVVPSKPRRRVIRSGGRIRVYTFTSRARNQGPDRYAELGPKALRGLLAVSEEGEELLAELTGRVGETLEELEEAGKLRGKLEENPRLDRLLAALRRVAGAYGLGDAAETWDLEVLERYPDDAAARREAVEQRLRMGLYTRALRLAGGLEIGGEDLPAELRVFRVLQEPARLEALLEEGSVSPGLATNLVPALHLKGRTEEARRVLAAVDPGDGKVSRSHARELLVPARVIGDREGVLRWCTAWLESCARLQHLRQASSALEGCVRRSWRFLDAEGRRSFLARLGSLAEEAREDGRKAVAWLLETWRGRLGGEAPEAGLDPASLSEELSRLYQLRSYWDLVPREHHATLLRRVLASDPRPTAYSVLSLVRNYPGEVGPEMEDAMVEAFKAGIGELDERLVSSTAMRLAGFTRDRGMVRRILEVVRSRFPGNGLLLLLVGQEAWLEGAREKATQTWERAFRELAARDKVDWSLRSVLDRVTGTLGQDGRAALLEALEALPSRDPPALGPLFIRAHFLQKEGRLQEAEELLRRAFEIRPGDDRTQSLLTSNLRQQGRANEAARVMRKWLDHKAEQAPWYLENLARLLWGEDRPLAALEVLDDSHKARNSLLGAAIQASLGREEELQDRVRGYLAELTTRSNFSAGSWPQPPRRRGLQTDGDEEGEEPAGPSWLPRLERSVWWRLAEMGAVREELLRAGRMRPERDFQLTDELDLALARVHFEARGPEAARREILEAAEAGVMEPAQGALLVVAAMEAPELVRDLDAAWGLLLNRLLASGSWAYQGMERYASLLIHAGRLAEARTITAWLLHQRDARSPSAPGEAIRQPLTLHLKTLSAETREEVERSWLERMQVSPLDKPRTAAGILKERLRRARDLGLAGRAQEARRRALELLEELEPGSIRRSLREAVLKDLAREGAVARFEELLRSALHNAENEGGIELIMSTSRILPDPEACSRPEDLVQAVRNVLEEGDLQAGRRGRVLARLAWWLLRARGPETAAPLIPTASESLGQRAHDHLVLADVARRAGDEDRAYDLEKELLERGALPAPRIPALLEEITRREGAAAADAWALRLAPISETPEVLARAIKAARKDGRTEDARTWLATLESVAPDHPALSDLRP